MISAVMAFAMALTMHVFASSAGAGSISGQVTDTENGSPLSYCNITISGTSQACVADEDGNYAFSNLAPGVYKIEARYVGYVAGQATADVATGKTAKLDFRLSPDAFMLDQVVVTSS